MHKMIMMTATLAMTLSAAATDYNWQATGNAANWDDTANWGGAGVPSTADDNAIFPATGALLQAVTLSDGNWGSAPKYQVSAISGGSNILLQFENRDNTLTVANPNGFTGLIQGNQARARVRTTSTADFTPLLGNVSAMYWTKIENAGTVGETQVRAYGNGRLGINTTYNDNPSMQVSGTIRMLSTGGKWQSAQVTKGKAIFEGTTTATALTRAQVTALEPTVHLDASAANTITLNDKGYVTEWRDANTGTAAAGQYNSLATPSVRANWSNGLSALDFGWYSGSDNLRCPSETYANDEWFANSSGQGHPAALKLASRMDDLKEIFFVFSDVTATNMISGRQVCAPYILGAEGHDQFARGNCGTLFAKSGMHDMDAVINGEVRINGRRVSYNQADNYAQQAQVVSIRGAKDMHWNLLGASSIKNDQSGKEMHLGGILLGEVIAFNKELSDAEREGVERYLMEKWLTAENIKRAELNLARLDLSQAGTAEFASDTFAAEEILTKSGTEFNKDGAGTLRVGRFTPMPQTFNVNAGALEFAQNFSGEFSDTAPAADPDVWLDATKHTTSMTMEGNSVVTWSDWRSDIAHTHATSSTAQPIDGGAANPTLDTTDPSHPFVNFGEQLTRTTGGAGFKIEYDKRTFDGFIVYRMHPNSTANLAFGSSSSDFVSPDNRNSIIAPWYNSAQGLSYTIRINGRTLNNQGASFTGDDPGEWNVYSVHSSRPINIDCLSNDRGGGYNYALGGGDIAEVIYYDRPLTAAEYHATEAYLMKKWLNKPHPAADASQNSISTLNFASGVKPTIASDTDLNVQCVRGSGVITKQGEGNVTIHSLEGSLEGFDVKGGTLDAGTVDFLSDALFHVDASQISSFVFAPGSDVQIDKWCDVRGNGLYAQAVVGDTRDAFWGLSYPRLCTSDGSLELPAGKPYVDFGTFVKGKAAVEALGEDEYASCMFWYTADGKKFTPNNVYEMHIVYKMDDGNTALVGCTSAGTGENGLVPNGDYRGGWWHTCTYINAGQKMNDGGAWFNNNTFCNWADATTTFHVLTLQATNAVQACTFAMDRDTACGRAGMRLCEVIIFADYTNSTERAEAINKYLLKKWKNIGEGADVPINFTTLNVAAGASLTAQCEMPFNCSTLTGGGTMNVTGVNGVDSIISDGGTIAVSGAVQFANEVSVDFSNGAPREIGEHVLLSAKSFSGADTATWTLNAPADPTYNYTLIVRDNTVVLKVSAKATLIIIR